MHKTWTQKPENVKRDWKLLNAENQSLGRLASSVAQLLMGKNKPELTPHVMGGDFVVIINADKVKLTGKKRTQKVYYKHSRYVGSLKETKAKDMPSQEMIKKAVQGMLPKNSHRPRCLKRLRIFNGPEHSFQDKKPVLVSL